MRKTSGDLARVCRAAGYEVTSYGLGPEGTFVYVGEEKILGRDVETWIRQRGDYPSREAIQIEVLRDEIRALRWHVNHLEDQSSAHLHALQNALAGTPGDPVLCYIEKHPEVDDATGLLRFVAWFTTQDLDKQWGDDWNDPLWDAGTPYEYRRGSRPVRDPVKGAGWQTVWAKTPWVVLPLHVVGPWSVPEHGTVETINKTRGVWLYPAPVTDKTTVPAVHAGLPLKRFKKIVERAGGTWSWPQRTEEPVFPTEK